VRITLYADYADWALWRGRRGLLSEDDLPLSEATKGRIRAWLNAYFDAPRPDWPLWTPPQGAAGTEAEEDAWVEEGETIRSLVQQELGPKHEVVYET
jgi:hypothetical protein